MPVSVHANLELLSWNELVSLKLYVECMPPNKLKNQSVLLKNIQLEYQRRKETHACGACNSAKSDNTQAELIAKLKEQKVL